MGKTRLVGAGCDQEEWADKEDLGSFGENPLHLTGGRWMEKTPVHFISESPLGLQCRAGAPSRHGLARTPVSHCTWTRLCLQILCPKGRLQGGVPPRLLLPPHRQTPRGSRRTVGLLLKMPVAFRGETRSILGVGARGDSPANSTDPGAC